jgi:putative ABC transport system ATP-binding protein
MTDKTAAAAGAVAVRVEHAVKSFRLGGGQELRAVDDVSVSIQRGSVVALTGPSGSGKSTLLHLIGAIERADSGRIEVDGCNLGELSRGRLADYRRGVGFVFQRYHLLPALTALDNVMAPVLPYRTGYDKVARARQLLESVGLGGREDAPPSRLSGGQQQRVAIARALIAEPQLLLADEPTGNLDSATGSEILNLLLRLREERGMTILLATHDPAIASRTDRLIRLRDGHLIDDMEVPGTEAGERVLERISRLDAS